ncbi:AAA family ATPase [Actinomadura sp. NEAU-AAG7]|uniref:AAA family ATPase n=1 Tax=Actinomadura sp. NEAU-AAG7 TaxID=2839640 RepID=UPI001BE4CB9E|nr:LuxR family transcriptional regulator [Actinomadura sp. NEAU-AAG7]MBT2207946.1 AAA family ATPase [Actinomadura sp. NEAU-AAG7]
MQTCEPDIDGGPGVRPIRRLYGRESETAVLTSALDAVAVGRPRMLSLEGAAGLGRSALLAAVRDDARRRGWRVLNARATILETANDFGVLRQVLAGLPALPDGRSAASLAARGGDASPFEVFERVSDHLCEFVGGGPSLITLDDVQWCDALTLRWLAHLAHRSAGALAIVLARTAGEGGERRLLVDELVAASERQTLRPLTPPQVRQWIIDVLGARPDEAFLERCHRATRGNAALLASLLPALAVRSVPPVRASAASIESVGVMAGRRMLPWIMRGGPEALAVAQAVVVLGDDGEPVLVAKLAGLELEEAAAALDRLIELGILSDSTPLRYVHPLVRAAVDAQISTGLRTSQRLRAARMVRDHHPDPGRAADHLMAVEMLGEPWALDTLRAAAADALEGGLPHRALGYLRRALAEPVTGPVRAELLADIGAAEIGADVPGGERTLIQALALADDPSLRARIGAELARLHADAGRPLGTALKVVEEVRALVPPERGEVVVEVELGAFAAYAASADADEFVERRLPALADLAAGDARLGALTGVAAAWTDTRHGRARAESVRRALAAVRVADPRRTWEARLAILAHAVLLAADQDGIPCDPDDMGGHSTRCQTAPGGPQLTAYVRGCLLHGRGALREAEARLVVALDAPLDVGAAAAARLARVLTDLGDLDAADRVLRDHAPPPQAQPAWAAAVFAFAKASLAMARDQNEDALEGFLETGETLRPLGIDNPALSAWRSRAARCGAALGDTRAAESLAAEEVALARRWGAPRPLSAALAAFGVVAADPDAAREAVAVLDGLDAGLLRAAALIDLGAVLLRGGDAEQAHERLQDGFALAHEINARPLSLRAARHLRRAGGKPDLGRLSGVTALTAQERAAADRAAAGATNRQIAEEMVLTQRTVEQYLTSAYRKLGISGRRQLAAALSA